MAARRVVVIGAGLTGLTAAFRLARTEPSLEVTVLEAAPHAGGAIRSDVTAGFTVDHGPGGFLASAPATLALVADLGLTPELAPASDAAQQRYLLHGGRLVAVPTAPVPFLRSPLLSPRARARLLLEPFAPRAPGGDESVHAFAARRVGREFADVLVSAMVRGVTAGDARQTSLSALFPRMAAMEAEHGSLTRALLARLLTAGRARRPGGRPASSLGGPAGPAGRLTSFRRGGMAHLVSALVASLGERVRTSCAVAALERRTGGYRVHTAGGEALPADAVIVATPAYAASSLLRPLAPEAADAAAAIPYAGVRVLALGYDRSAVSHPLDGFGYLVPPGEPSAILGCLWTSSLFPGQAPDGRVLLRVIAGGATDPAVVERSDAEALDAVQVEVARTLGISAAPMFVQQVVWRRGIPQYTLGHGERVRAIEAALSGLPGLVVAGNAYRGVGVNDCVAGGERAAAAIRPR